MAESAAPEALGFREFATRIGCKPGYVTALKSAGRLVLTADGRKVLVAESLRLIADTRDPAKEGVRARHAAARGDSAASSPSSAAESEGGDSGADEAPAPISPSDPLAKRRALAQAEREEALARKALRDEQVELGQLLRVEDVRATVADAVMVFRTALQNLPATLPLVEERDRPVVADGIEHVLGELERKFGAIGRSNQ